VQAQQSTKNEFSLVRLSAAEYLTFIASSGQGGIDAVYADANVWLTQKMMGLLYDVAKMIAHNASWACVRGRFVIQKTHSNPAPQHLEKRYSVLQNCQASLNQRLLGCKE
jgi:hypothetical protein